MSALLARPGPGIGGRVRVPGDKSISHRALLLGAIAEGEVDVTGFLEGEDCIATRRALEALGVRIEDTGPGALRVHGHGPGALRQAAEPLDMGNSGTGMRLMAGLLAGTGTPATLVGDASLSRRPMERVAAPLREMGASVDTDDGHPPMTIGGGHPVHAIDYSLPVASAQVKSAVLLAGLGAEGLTRVRQPATSRDHTERMLANLGADIRYDEHVIELTGPARLRGGRVEVPGDLSSAAFLIVAALIGGREPLIIENVGVNPTRTGILEILRRMGGRIELTAERLAGAEPVADLRVEKSDLKGIDVPPSLVPLAIDEFPVLFVAAAAARGVTRVTGAEELRYKESDRLAAMADALGAVGVQCRLQADGMDVSGGPIAEGTVDSLGDHRVAMSMAVAATVAEGPVTIRDTAAVATSFPGFVDTARSVGLDVSAVEEGRHD